MACHCHAGREVWGGGGESTTTRCVPPLSCRPYCPAACCGCAQMAPLMAWAHNPAVAHNLAMAHMPANAVCADRVPQVAPAALCCMRPVYLAGSSSSLECQFPWGPSPHAGGLQRNMLLPSTAAYAQSGVGGAPTPGSGGSDPRDHHMLTCLLRSGSWPTWGWTRPLL